jgi:uncharacterized membrane protein YfcA
MTPFTNADIALLALLIFAVTVLYSAVGQGGGSGYLAAMALFGLAPAAMKPAALALNLVVTALTTARYAQAGHFSWRLCWPFLASSVPLAFLGGALSLNASFYGPAVGVLLFFAAYRLFLERPTASTGTPRPARLALAMLCGAAIGFVSGLTGIGGGILLGPLLLVMGWAEPRRAAATSSAFILVNSLAGLGGYLVTADWRPAASVLPAFAAWAGMAAAGGLIGAELGSRHLSNLALQRLLAVLLVVAGGKLMLV